MIFLWIICNYCVCVYVCGVFVSVLFVLAYSCIRHQCVVLLFFSDVIFVNTKDLHSFALQAITAHLPGVKCDDKFCTMFKLIYYLCLRQDFPYFSIRVSRPKQCVIFWYDVHEFHQYQKLYSKTRLFFKKLLLEIEEQSHESYCLNLAHLNCRETSKT